MIRFLILQNKKNLFIQDDQKRVTTPREAFKQGSDWLVIGRDLTKGNIKSNFKKLSDHLS